MYYFSSFFFFSKRRRLMKKTKLQDKIYKSSDKLEKQFQKEVIRDLKNEFENSIVTKLDSGHTQGIPDLLILYGNKWATLECKKSKKAHRQPNQEYYVNKMNNMSFSRFIYPENKEEVFDELHKAFKS